MTLDTQVMVLKPEHGLIGGYCILFNRWGFGSWGKSTVKFRAGAGVSYQWAVRPPLLFKHDFTQDVGECFGQSMFRTKAGLYCYATLRDPALLFQAAAGLLYFSPMVINDVRGAKTAAIVEVSLVHDPGIPPSLQHLAENEAVRSTIDAIRTALELDTAHAPEDEATGYHEGEPGYVPELIDAPEPSPYEQLVGPQTGQSRDYYRRLGIGA